MVGCKEKPVTTPGDLENPRIVMTSPIELPEGQFIPILSSDSFFVDVTFTDDIELRDWEITIRFQPEMSYLRTAVQPWKETWFGDLDGVSGAVNFKEYVSYDPTAGYYKFTVKVSDMEGKTDELSTYFLVGNRQDLTAPTIVFTEPDTVNIDTFAIGSNINIIARCEELGDVVRDARLRVRDVLTGNILEGSEIRWDTVYAAPLLIDTFVTVPAGAVPGNYNVEIFCNDMTNNVVVNRAEIYIKPN